MNINQLGTVSMYEHDKVIWDIVLEGKPLNKTNQAIYRKDYIEQLRQLLPDRARLSKFTNDSSIPLRFMKTHNANFNIAGEMEKNDKIIYVVRNPLDVAISLLHYSNMTTMDEVCQFITDKDSFLCSRLLDDSVICDIVSSWKNHVNNWIDNENYSTLVLTYESLLTNPKENLRKMIRFLGYPIDNNQIEKAVNWSSFDLLKKQELSSGFNENNYDLKNLFFREGKMNQWKTELTKPQHDLIVDDCKSLMNKFGFSYGMDS
jgi:Sulfotransferase domain